MAVSSAGATTVPVGFDGVASSTPGGALGPRLGHEVGRQLVVGGGVDGHADRLRRR